MFLVFLTESISIKNKVLNGLLEILKILYFELTQSIKFLLIFEILNTAISVHFYHKKNKFFELRVENEI